MREKAAYALHLSKNIIKTEHTHARGAPTRPVFCTNTETPVGGARILYLPKISDRRGNLTFIEGSRHVPFPIRRVYYVYDVPAGALRGGHAHETCEEFIIAASGSFAVVIDDGRQKQTFYLNRPHYGLYVPRMAWRELEDFSSGSICLVLTSEEYDESDYYRTYRAFLKALRKKRNGSVS